MLDSRALAGVDLDAVRQRARTIAHELAQVTRPPMSKAMAAAHDLHLERARDTAAHLLHDLGDRTLATPGLVRAAAQRVEHGGLHVRPHLKRRPERFRVARVAASLLPLVFGLRKARKKGERRWRR
jgi:hypothetical protein